jgi:hypothetical protein
LSHEIDSTTLSELPMPLWSAARVSDFLSNAGAWRTKFMCDPLRCDRLGVHFTLNMFCQRYPNITTTSCKSIEPPITTGLVHHARARPRNPNVSPPICSDVEGLQEIDWTMTNRAIKIIRSGDFLIWPILRGQPQNNHLNSEKIAEGCSVDRARQTGWN